MPAAGNAAAALDVARLGRVLVVVPHPDDESIGCGGLLALLGRRGAAVSVLLLTDGEMSHPGSRRWNAAARAAWRRGELTRALAELGVGVGIDAGAEADALRPLGLPDGAVAGPGDDGFDAAVAAVADVLRERDPDTLLLPWRRDPHRDHRAGSAIARTANAALPRPARVLEYLVWAPERGTAADDPALDEVRRWRLDLDDDAVARKLRAVAAHRSQCGAVFDDDPAGFTLPATLRERCAVPCETFYEEAAVAAAVTDPAVTDPAVTDSAVTDSAVTDSAVTHPA